MSGKRRETAKKGSTPPPDDPRDRLMERLRYAGVKAAYARELLDANAQTLERARLGGVLSEIAAALDATLRAIGDARDAASPQEPPPPSSRFSDTEPTSSVNPRKSRREER